MRLDSFESKLKSLGENPEKSLLMEIASDIGDELPRNRWEVVREARSLMAACREHLGDSEEAWLARGYLMALCNVCASFEAYERDQKVIKTYKPILFVDFDGTLCHDRFWRSMPPNEQNAIQKWLFQENKDLVRMWMVGGCTSEEINHCIADQLNIPFERLWEVFVRDCKSMVVSSSVLENLVLLRSRFELVLLTDNMDCFTRFAVPALNLWKYFDRIINSYNERMSKRELLLCLIPESLRKLSIIIDDSHGICELFEQLGGVSCLVTAGQDIDYHIDILLRRDR
ncbi:MAG: hypothetical protein HZA35_03125 [Parcubacteria group bacterium]|nr:hypothetical protein [Parcubacteria group bacterium]